MYCGFKERISKIFQRKTEAAATNFSTSLSPHIETEQLDSKTKTPKDNISNKPRKIALQSLKCKQIRETH
jgi:hypothetical protein